MNYYIVFKVGKHTYFKMDIIDIISEATKQSKSNVKRLIKDGAIDMYYQEDDVCNTTSLYNK